MEVEETYSIEELYDKVKEYDVVFTSEAAMMSALNDRLEEPILRLKDCNLDLKSVQFRHPLQFL